MHFDVAGRILKQLGELVGRKFFPVVFQKGVESEEELPPFSGRKSFHQQFDSQCSQKNVQRECVFYVPSDQLTKFQKMFTLVTRTIPSTKTPTLVFFIPDSARRALNPVFH